MMPMYDENDPPMSEETAETMAQQARQRLQRVRQEMKGREMDFAEATGKHQARMDDLDRQRRGLEALLEHTDLQQAKQAPYDDGKAEVPSGTARW